MAINNHIHLFKVDRDYSATVSEIKTVLYENFYEPTAKEIFSRWLDEIKNLLDQDQQKRLYLYLDSNDQILEEVFFNIIIYLNERIDVVSQDDYTYILILEDKNIFTQIYDIVLEMMTEDGYKM